MSDTLPREIAFEEIQVGDTIRAEYTARGVRVTRQGVVGNVNRRLAATRAGGPITYDDGDIITLMDRPAPPRMAEPAKIGSVVVAGIPSCRYLTVRTGGPTSGPWRWRESADGIHLRWDDITDPRPATEQEIEECRVIEP